VDPSDWIKTQRQMSLAQALQGMSLSPVQNDLQQPQGGKYFQMARVGKTAALSKLADALMANKGFTGQVLPGVGDPGSGGALGAMGRQYQQAQQAFQPGGQQVQGQPLQAAPPPSDPNAQSVQPAMARPNGQSFDQTVQRSQPGVTPTNPMNPQGIPANAMLRLWQSDPAKYASMIAGPESVQLGKMAGYTGPQAATAAFNKSQSLDARPGGAIYLPDGRIIRNPTLPAGMEPTTYDAQGNPQGAQNIPGMVPALGAQKAVETASTQANTPRMIPQGGGVEKLGYPPTPPALQNQAPPGQQGKYFSGAPPAPPMPQPPPSARTPAQVGPVKNPQTGQYDNNLWPNIPKMAIPNSPGSTSDAYSEGILGASVKRHQELVDKLGEGSAQAVLSNNYLDQALKHLPAAETGPMSEWLTENRGKLIETMPSLGPILGGTESVTPTLELNKALVNSGLQGAKANFGRLTQSEVMLQKDEMSPSAKMTHDAIASLIHQQQVKNGYAIQQDKDYSEYHTQGGDPNRFEAQYNVRRPISRFAAQYDTPPAALDRLKQQPELLPAFVKKYNWDPSQ
jgi:hypothetical protein